MENILGNRIKSLRQEFNLNQVELAKKINVSNTTLSQYESGQRIPSDDVKIKIADIFNVSLDYLLGYSDIRNPYREESLPENFTTAEEAAKFLLEQQAVMAYGDFDTNKLSDDEKIQFANELLQQIKLLGYKYKK